MIPDGKAILLKHEVDVDGNVADYTMYVETDITTHDKKTVVGVHKIDRKSGTDSTQEVSVLQGARNRGKNGSEVRYEVKNYSPAPASSGLKQIFSGESLFVNDSGSKLEAHLWPSAYSEAPKYGGPVGITFEDGQFSEPGTFGEPGIGMQAGLIETAAIMGRVGAVLDVATRALVSPAQG